ncbi:hypothetical protein N7E70_024790 [Aminobacter sp. NyZ550]|uniref:Uncharacterized protein n=1 Tax=Aminobacter ciceronei TaxID=150723 RepID=A0ABR6CEF9_9HYPH|nr:MULTISPECIES: hypothetical protein [Aminobacter]MBA8909717.1 hypothetical protein [Aminobacter ciceronei]MBA9023429.1 hypothetical protein [Aminobacter ciceronei]MDR7224700.1 hypothetical protein [Aminobacter aminovorans]WAX94836.1 hypothetical protein N7E70_024790 [Aminobacter sp. NyZ550]WMC98283.1 hypothetical protein RAR13_06160 [Aminobacter aminovorans]
MTVQSKRRYHSIMLWMLVPAGLLLFAGANAHLIYVAVDSQPDCVKHFKAAGEGGYRAAKSAC